MARRGLPKEFRYPGERSFEKRGKVKVHHGERGENMLKKIGIWILVLGFSFALFAGCAAMKLRSLTDTYSVYQARLQKLKARGGAEKAPYETAKAEGYLKAFKEELAEKDPKGAELFREKTDEYLNKGTVKAR
jgi:hypothetical protein